MAHEKVIFFPGIGANTDPSSNLLIENLQQVSGTLGMELKVAATIRQDAAFLIGHPVGALPQATHNHPVKLKIIQSFIQ